MQNQKSYLRQALASGLLFGLGLVLGNIVSSFIFQNISPARFWGDNQALRLVGGIFLAFFITGIGGFIGGAIGGRQLPVAKGYTGRWGYTWKSGIVLGIGYGLVVFPALLVLTLFSFYDLSAINPTVYSLLYGIIGLIFGLLVGMFLGRWTLRNRYSIVAWSSAVGFGVGGLVLGYAFWRFLYSISEGNVGEGQWLWALFGLAVFGTLGGAGLGYGYRYALLNRQLADDLIHQVFWTRRRRFIVISIGLILGVVVLRPIMSAIGDLLTPVDASLSRTFDSNTIGTHWLASSALAEAGEGAQMGSAVAAGPDGAVGVVWSDGAQGILLRLGSWSAVDQRTAWAEPILVSAAAAVADSPQFVYADDGTAHVVWSDATGAGAIAYSRCGDDGCSEPVELSVPADANCSDLSPIDRAPSIAVNDEALMVVWQNDAGVLPYMSWAVDAEPASGPNGCVPDPAGGGYVEPQIVADPENGFTLIFRAGSGDRSGEIYIADYVADGWGEISPSLGIGHSPSLIVDSEAKVHAAWCGLEDLVTYGVEGLTETVATLPCRSRPAPAIDDEGRIHLVWYTDQIENVDDQLVSSNLLVEAVRGEDGWLPTAIVEQTVEESRPELVGASDGSLHLAWLDGGQLRYAAQLQYNCEGDDLSRLGQIIYDIEREEAYTSPSDPIPYCQNQYDQLIFTPKADPAFSDQPVTTNGAFDVLGDRIREARYEVLFSTMWYHAAKDNDSPGTVIAAAVADLYRELQANPDNYPRGLTVRIMLGSPPELITGEVSGQLWSLIDDLRQAGIEKMIDPQIGWRLEVANYEGNLPHSHVKSLIVDGKTAVSAGFNMTYDHFASDHPSGQGGGRFDLGVQVTGPVAQSVQRMFDDMWMGADQRHCLYLNPPLAIPWQATCYDKTASAAHAPEVLKYYLPGGSSDVFSLYRSKARDSADRQIASALAAAEESIDTVHVNFSLNMVCALNILYNVCNFSDSHQYMDGLLQAAKQGAKVRILVKPSPVEGIENAVAITAFEERLGKLGLADRVELRFFDGPMHPKAALIDDELLIIGSQNFHYSAFGEGTGLNEQSLALDDPQAREDYKRVFEYQWEKAAPLK